MDQQYINYLLELMHPLGPVSARRMFGGWGIFMHGRMFALVADQVLYFKVDTQNKKRFTDLGLGAFTYYSQGAARKMAYFKAPEEVLESPEMMEDWAGMAVEVARRAASRK